MRHRDLDHLARLRGITVALAEYAHAQTGHYFDDTKRYVDALDIGENDRYKVFEGNARRVYPRLDQALKTRGK